MFNIGCLFTDEYTYVVRSYTTYSLSGVARGVHWVYSGVSRSISLARRNCRLLDRTAWSSLHSCFDAVGLNNMHQVHPTSRELESLRFGHSRFMLNNSLSLSITFLSGMFQLHDAIRHCSPVCIIQAPFRYPSCYDIRMIPSYEWLTFEGFKQCIICLDLLSQGRL